MSYPNHEYPPLPPSPVYSHASVSEKASGGTPSPYLPAYRTGPSPGPSLASSTHSQQQQKQPSFQQGGYPQAPQGYPQASQGYPQASQGYYSQTYPAPYGSSPMQPGAQQYPYPYQQGAIPTIGLDLLESSSDPTLVTCPYCHATGLTLTKSKANIIATIVFILFLIPVQPFLLIFGLIALLVFQDTEHKCGTCRSRLGKRVACCC